ncbi:hypothetical protein [Streptomyces sp. NBRC 110035]|uniref:DUF6197 family protein n=1 Tax=Streptomyces sp. NBRC 110035 TaxID=1547867 RepID=UPI0005A812CF|nr:hypothetical protein [Streptomyces sp. NBRC 110035]
MTATRTPGREPRTVPPSAVPARPAPARSATAPATPAAPPWTHRLLPAALRNAMTDLGWWQNPTPQKPSAHLKQVLDTLHRYGWCQSLDVSPTGRMCIRGAQNLLEKTGHVTPAARERAVAYMQQTLNEAGIQMSFFTWNDLPGQTPATVETLLVKAAYKARANGE